jgi:hypothetical protein
VRALIVLASVLALSGTGAAWAHRPGSDGGAAQRSCGALSGVSRFGPVGVGATRTSCRIARQVAAGSVRGRRFSRWRCTGMRTRFGHCHGRGVRRGAVVHWFAAH